MSIKHEMHKGRPSWVVNNVIRTYDEAEALRLDSATDETPIDMLATDKFIVTFDGLRCVLRPVERRSDKRPWTSQTMDSYAPPAGEETYRDRLRQAELKK